MGLWAKGPALLWGLPYKDGPQEGPQEPTLRADTFRKQITDDKVFYKQITNDKAGYGTKRGPFRTKLHFLASWKRSQI